MCLVECMKKNKKSGVWSFIAMLLLFLCAGCKKANTSIVPMLISSDNKIDTPVFGSYTAQASGVDAVFSFSSSSYCVPDATIADQNDIQAKAAFLFNITDQKVIYIQNCFEKIYPASTTKVLTALTLYRILEEEGRSLDEEVVIQQTNGGITAYGAKLCGLKRGETTSLDGLLNALLVYSANDAGVAIAQYLCGSEEAFVERMNKVAREIGATHTYFSNSHGLHQIEHYTTAYDMYLIFRECLSYHGFREIMKQKSYTLLYTDAEKNKCHIELESTFPYLLGNYQSPDGVIVGGGKTGSTPSAGDCLILLSSYNGAEYISAVFGADSKDQLYSEMTKLLSMELSDNRQE